ncbi:MAG: PEP-CTERM sorting domain-containing protein [Gammaproteobacteria bacterium]|nr:PEP-CTERM sorting domain-containing protein [Gammaproteobacteria bacterium]MBU1409259.1 PEP-CTERM sorting domain-containing protein [Gammaproteobacteria bacterium]MBU1531155.1 PEP-CTERM sorting domain-containing protein [Gammaproteobacteria bacterium]
MRNQRSLKLACLLAGVAMCGAGSAIAANWTFTGSTLEQPAGYGAAQDTAGSATATVTAWANTANGSEGSNTVLASAYLTPQGSSGLGIKHADGETTSSPQHAADNYERKESFLFSFAGDKVNLTSSYFGWIANDSDFSVYAYTGAGAGSVSGLTYGNLTSNGWTLVGHYNEVSQSNNSGDTKSFANTIFSSYWLIGAYNGGGADSKSDYFKLKTVSGLTCADTPGGQGCGGGSSQVPEPGTLLLVSMGLLGLTRMSRRREAR